MDSASAWGQLEPGWKVAFEQAWQAFQSGSFPVGAALVGPDGQVLAVGRNRIFDKDRPAGSLLAHAEVAALGELSPDERYDAVTLFTTLEPCLFCIGAVVLSRVGTVRFAGADGYGGAARFPSELNAQTARYELEIHGPVVGPFGRLGTALTLAYLLASDRWTRVIEHAKQTDSGLLELSRELGSLEILRTPNSFEFEDVLAQAWPVLLAGV